MIDAHVGGVLVNERELARPLLSSVEAGMLLESPGTDQRQGPQLRGSEPSRV